MCFKLATMEICKNRIYEVGSYRFCNFVTLEDDIIETIRIWRNHPEIRNLMYNQDEISKDQHNNFINKLKVVDDKFYWLVEYDNKPFGVASLVDFDKENRVGELGYYISPEYIGSGLGFQFILTVYYFLFKNLGLQKVKGCTRLENIDALMINKFLGNVFSPVPVTIKGNKYIEMQCEADSFMAAYVNKDDMKSLIKFKKSFKEFYNVNYGYK